MKKHFSFILAIFLVLLSANFVASAPVTGLDVNLMNTPALLNKDLNIGISWTGTDLNTIYIQFDSDGNTTLSQSAISDLNVIDNFNDGLITGWTRDEGLADFNATTDQFYEGTHSMQGAGDTSYTLDETIVFDKNYSIWVRVTSTNVNGSLIGLNPFWVGFNRGGFANKFAIYNGSGYSDFNGTNPDIVADTWYEFVFNPIDATHITIFIKNEAGTILAEAINVSGGAFSDNWYVRGVSGVTYVDYLTSFVGTGFITPLTTPQYSQHSFTTSGAKTITVTAQNVDGNTTSTLDLNIFENLKITAWDENKGVALVGASIDFNSGTYTTDASGQISIPLADLTTGTYTIGLDMNSDFTARSFVYDLNQFSNHDLNLLLLETSDGSSRDYRIYQPDKTTLITSSIVEWRRTVTIANGISQRTATSSTGTLSFFGQQDANYVMRITDEVSDVTRNYSGTIVTVKKPLNIEDTSEEVTPYNIEIGGLATQSFTSISANQTFKIFSDTTGYYSFVVDANAEWFPTSKLIKTLGGAATEEFQPYLVPVDGTNIETSVYTIDNPEGRVTISGIRIDSYTTIGGSSVLVESKYSDGTGLALFHFEKGREYTLKFYNASGTLLISETIEATSTSLFAYLETGGTSTTPTPQFNVGVEWHPSIGSLVPVDQNVSFWMLLKPTEGTIGDVNVYISSISDTNIVFNTIYSVNSASDYNLSFDFNIAGFNDDYPLKVSLQIFDDSGTQIGAIRTKSYSFKDTGFVAATERAKDSLGQLGVTLLALMITVALISFLTTRALGEDTNMVVIPTMFITGLFMWIGWITFDAWASGVFFGIGVALWSVKK